MKKFLINILCSFVPNRQARKRIRFMIENRKMIKKMKKFVIGFSDKKHPQIKYTFGFRCANLVVSLDNKWVFKFPFDSDNGKEISIREKRITDCLRSISPVKIPDMEIIEWNGIFVRKYEYVSGVGFRNLSRKEQNENAEKIAKQLAKFLYVVGKSDPAEIADLKNNKSDKPSMMHGWNQNDLWDNFIMNPTNFEIVGIIDWESAGFNDFYDCFTHGTKNSIIKTCLLREYLKLAK